MDIQSFWILTICWRKLSFLHLYLFTFGKHSVSVVACSYIWAYSILLIYYIDLLVCLCANPLMFLLLVFFFFFFTITWSQVWWCFQQYSYCSACFCEESSCKFYWDCIDLIDHFVEYMIHNTFFLICKYRPFHLLVSSTIFVQSS